MNIGIGRDKFTNAFFDLGIIDQFDELCVDSAVAVLRMDGQVLQTFGIGLSIVETGNGSDGFVIEHTDVEILPAFKALLNEA